MRHLIPAMAAKMHLVTTTIWKEIVVGHMIVNSTIICCKSTGMPGKTPKLVNATLRAVMIELSPAPARYVQVEPDDNSTVGNCHRNVQAHVIANGGAEMFGWIVRDAKRFYDFEFHCVWGSPEGTLVDVTPRADSATAILFLPDPVRRFDHATRMTWANRAYHKQHKTWAFVDGDKQCGERVLIPLGFVL